MKVTVEYYKNSALASIVHVIGNFFISLGFVSIFACFEAFLPAVLFSAVFFALGYLFRHWAERISDYMAFIQWWGENVEDNLLEPVIKESADFANQIYMKNPQERTLKRIAELNPEAAQLIRKGAHQF